MKNDILIYYDLHIIIIYFLYYIIYIKQHINYIKRMIIVFYFVRIKIKFELIVFFDISNKIMQLKY